MRMYVPQRQRLPPIASSICASVGFFVFISRAAADMICPAWQYPHCGTFSASHARCSGCVALGERPSIVVILFPITFSSAVLQERIASPFASTVHEPQKPRPQPNLVPVIPSSSRQTQSNGVSGDEEMVGALPLMVSFVGMARILWPMCRARLRRAELQVRSSAARPYKFTET